jgi:hypothetical protein
VIILVVAVAGVVLWRTVIKLVIVILSVLAALGLLELMQYLH